MLSRLGDFTLYYGDGWVPTVGCSRCLHRQSLKKAPRWPFKDPLPQDFGTALLTRLTTNSQSVMDSIDMTMRNTFCGEVIALLLEELHSKIDATRRSHLEVFAAAYVFLHSRLMPESELLS